MKGADILVFPEYGLTSTNLQGGDVLSLSQVVPHPKDYVVLCQLNYTDDHTKVTRSSGWTVVINYGHGGGDAVQRVYLVHEEVLLCANLWYLKLPQVGVDQSTRLAVTLCKGPTLMQVLGELSCGAAQFQLYLVVDLIEVDHCDTQCLLDCPNTGYRLYNTQVVLDRCGAVVARLET